MTLHENIVALDAATEVRTFQDQPAQMRAAAPGKIGELRLGFSLKDGRHILHDLYRVAPLLVQQALYWDEAMPELPICSMISVGGGILQGDRYLIDITVEEEACAHVTSQGATRVHQMDANYASQHQRIEVRAGAYLEYLPDMTIPYRGSRFIAKTNFIVADDATLLYGETMMTGRKHHREDERFGFDMLSLTTSLQRPDGTQLFKEKILVERGNPTVDFEAVMRGFDVFANVICVTSPDIAIRIRTRFETTFTRRDASAISTLSQLPNCAGLMLRVVGRESYHCRNEIRRFWKIVREEARERTLPTAFLWR